MPSSHEEANYSPAPKDQSSANSSLRINDPFLFYSFEENLHNARNLRPIDDSNGGTDPSTPVVRKTRISFETDLLNLMAEYMLQNDLDV